MHSRRFIAHQLELWKRLDANVVKSDFTANVFQPILGAFDGQPNENPGCGSWCPNAIEHERFPSRRSAKRLGGMRLHFIALFVYEDKLRTGAVMFESLGLDFDAKAILIEVAGLYRRRLNHHQAAIK